MYSRTKRSINVGRKELIILLMEEVYDKDVSFTLCYSIYI